MNTHRKSNRSTIHSHTPSTTTTNRTELHQMVLNINKKYPNYYLQIEPNHYLQIEPNHYPQIEPKHYLQPTNSYKSNRITTYKSNRITTYKSNRILPTNRTKPCLRNHAYVHVSTAQKGPDAVVGVFLLLHPDS